jgi:taurine dioxygenase
MTPGKEDHMVDLASGALLPMRAPLLEIVPEAAALGARIPGIDVRRLDAAQARALRQALLDHLVIVIPQQDLSDDDLVRIARQFGQLALPPAANERSSRQVHAGPAEITVVSNIKENGQPVGELGDAEVVWHSDYSFKEIPAAARMLYGIEIPPSGQGANTVFINCYAAFDTLAPDTKRSLIGKTIKQDRTLDTNLNVRLGAPHVDDLRTGPGPDHVIVSMHPETGHNSLFLGRRPKAYVNGLELGQSEALLDELWKHVTQPRLQYEHEWRQGDLVIWDNRCTLHRRSAFSASARRLMHAAQIVGHKPFEAPHALSRPPHPRFRQFEARA